MEECFSPEVKSCVPVSWQVAFSSWEEHLIHRKRKQRVFPNTKCSKKNLSSSIGWRLGVFCLNRGRASTLCNYKSRFLGNLASTCFSTLHWMWDWFRWPGKLCVFITVVLAVWRLVQWTVCWFLSVWRSPWGLVRFACEERKGGGHDEVYS